MVVGTSPYKLLSHLDHCGIALHVSCPGTPEQNGVAKHKHRHIVETGLTMLFHARLPKNLRLEAFFTAVYLINRLPSSTIGMHTPFFKLHGIHPDYKSLKVFGCRCFPYLRDYAKNKFEPKSYPCVFLGYSPIHKGYRCLHPPTKRVYLSRHVVFDESILPFTDPKLLFSPGPTDSTFTTYAECVTGFLPSQPSSHPSSSPGPSHSPHSFTSSSTPTVPMATPSDLAPILDLTSVNTTTPTPTPESAPTPPSADIATPEPSCIVIEPPMPDLQVTALTAAPKPDSPPSAASCPVMDPPATEPFVTAPPASPAQPTLTVSSMVTSTPTINLIPPLTVHTEPLSPSVPLSPSTTSNDIVSPIQSGTLYIDLPMDPLPITSIPQPRPTNTHPMLTRGKAREHHCHVVLESTDPTEPKSI